MGKVGDKLKRKKKGGTIRKNPGIIWKKIWRKICDKYEENLLKIALRRALTFLRVFLS